MAPLVQQDRLIGRLPNFEYMSAVTENGIGPTELDALREAGLRLMNVAACLGGDKAEAGGHRELSRDLLDAKGHMKVTPYVQRYIEGEYYKKSHRCRGCALTSSCQGMHIQFLRAHGFASLSPIPGDGASIADPETGSVFPIATSDAA